MLFHRQVKVTYERNHTLTFDLTLCKLTLSDPRNSKLLFCGTRAYLIKHDEGSCFFVFSIWEFFASESVCKLFINHFLKWPFVRPLVGYAEYDDMRYFVHRCWVIKVREPCSVWRIKIMMAWLRITLRIESWNITESPS